MIYLEIIEINFCGLNKNTKRNIQIRSANELLKQDDRDFSIGAININKDYAIDSKNVNDDNIGNIIEMNNQVETDVSWYNYFFINYYFNENIVFSLIKTYKILLIRDELLFI